MSEILDTVVGYGIDLSLTEWKNNVNSLLYEKISRVNYGIWDRYQEFFELYGDDYDSEGHYTLSGKETEK